jgi:hypothetical protein
VFLVRKIFLVLENGGAVRWYTHEKARFITTGFGFIDISSAGTVLLLSSLFPCSRTVTA